MGGKVTCSSQLGSGAKFKIKMNSKCKQIVRRGKINESKDFVIIHKHDDDKELKLNDIKIKIQP